MSTLPLTGGTAPFTLTMPVGALPQGLKHGLSVTVVEAVKLWAIERKAAAVAYVRGAVDFPSNIQVRVPSYLRERSP